MKKIYIAGPNIFKSNWFDYKNAVAKTFLTHKLEAVFPVDSPSMEYRNIASLNLGLVDSCFGVCANLKPFRGCEPDSGTVFELSYAFASKKTVCAFCPSQTLRERVDDSPFAPVTQHDDGWPLRDRNGSGVEGFDLRQNLMIASFIPMFYDYHQCANYFVTLNQSESCGSSK